MKMPTKPPKSKNRKNPQLGSGRKAHGVTPKIKQANLYRLKRIEGQIRGLQQMVHDDRYCPEILIQLAAVSQALAAVRAALLATHLEHCVAHALRRQASGSYARRIAFADSAGVTVR